MNRSTLEHESWLAVVQAYQVCTRQYARMLTNFDLTIAQFDAMSRIDELSREQALVTPREIAAAMLVTRGNLTGLLQRLQARRLVGTRAHPDDGRSIVCRLTPSGANLLRRARRASSAFIREQLAPFADADLIDTRDQMRRMAAHLETLSPAALAAAADKTRKAG